jgi:hydrogenase maturation protein HypF
MAERGIKDKVIGVAFDGTGYGMDGNLWGGEFLVCDLNGFERAAHFKYIPLPGGTKAIKDCWRTAISYIVKSLEFKVMSYEGKGVYQGIDSEPRTLNSKVVWDCLNSIGFVNRYGRNNIENILKIIDNRQFSPLSSGAGRLFDAVSAIAGICDENTFEGEAAIALENIVHGSQFTVHNEIYPFEILDCEPLIVDFSKMILQIIGDVRSKENKGIIAVRFHNTIVNVITEAVNRISKKYRINDVVLSGGVFQNEYLLDGVFRQLSSLGFNVYTNEKVPCNDAGISLGQAYIIRERLKMHAPKIHSLTIGL